MNQILDFGNDDNKENNKKNNKKNKEINLSLIHI